MKPLEIEYMDLQEASTFLNLKQSRLRTAIFRKEIPFLKVGGLIRFRRNDLIHWMESLLISPADRRDFTREN